MDNNPLTCICATATTSYRYNNFNFCIFIVALVLLPPQKSVKRVVLLFPTNAGNLDSEFGSIFNGVMKIPNSITIRSVVFELKPSNCRPAEGYS
jgi:hypothetical protein